MPAQVRDVEQVRRQDVREAVVVVVVLDVAVLGSPVAAGDADGTAQDGYVKKLNYDDRLANILPPYLFDISDSGWHISRETLCTPPGTGSNTTTTCQ